LAKSRPLKICLASSELTPLAKTGGLADVCSALSAYLHSSGHDIRVLMPLYSSIDTTGLDIQPVNYLQNIPIRIGHRQGVYSIDTCVLPGSQLPIYLLRCPDLYDRKSIYTSAEDEHLRFILLSRAAIEMCQHMNFAPDIFHCHDWHTALIPLLLKSVYAWDSLFRNTRSVLTIHNIGYQGIFGSAILPDLGLANNDFLLHQDDLKAGRINFLKTGVLHADFLTTVSPTYAREIQGDEYGMGLQGILRKRNQSLLGILNGVDYEEWNPAKDPLIPHSYDRRSQKGKLANKLGLMQELGIEPVAERPLIGIVTRLTSQKGIDLIKNVLPVLLKRRDIAVAALGSGEPDYEQFFSWLQSRFGDRVCFYRGYSNQLAHWIEAASDIFLMPSLYEPCGLNQMYSLKYGTVPVVRATGGLADSVVQINPKDRTGTGILFRDYNDAGLNWAINTALDLYQDKPLWRQVMKNGMAVDFSWKRQGDLYVKLFKGLSNIT
jgi:starch synthase